MLKDITSYVRTAVNTFAFLPSLYCFDLCNSITGVEYADFRLKQIIVMMWMCQYLFTSKTSKKNLTRRGIKHRKARFLSQGMQEAFGT